MTLEEFKCDILHVLENNNYRNSLLEKLESYFRNIRSNVTAQVEKKLLYEEKCINQKSINATKILELQQEIDMVTSNIDSITSQQAVIDEKISKAIKSQNSVNNELQETKKLIDALSSEITDLELNIEERKNKKIQVWEATKRACNIYKIHLDMHISLQEEDDCQNVKVTFFTNNEETKDKYFVQLLHSNNSWKVKCIEPKLKKDHYSELSIVEDPSGHSKVLDITLFLCEIRSLYLKYYKNLKKIVK